MPSFYFDTCFLKKPCYYIHWSSPNITDQGETYVVYDSKRVFQLS